LWSFPNNNGHDVQHLKNGNILIVTNEVQEVTPAKEIVWKVGRPLIRTAEAAQRLANSDSERQRARELLDRIAKARAGGGE